MPQLYRELSEQLSQWVVPSDRRHLQVFAEILGAILSSGSGCLSHWLPYLSHRDCQARSHLERLSYFFHNPAITSTHYAVPLIRTFLCGWSGQAMLLVLDTSMLNDEYCLIEVCLVWGGRSLPLAQIVLEHASAMVGFEQYRPALEAVNALLPQAVEVTFLADRGFMHGELMRWLTQQGWDWAIRAKSDLLVTLHPYQVQSLEQLFPQKDEVALFPNVQILGDITCHLAVAQWSGAKDTWAVLTNRPLSLQTFHLYGQRFGGIEPHFKDYKSGGFNVERSRLRDAQALSRLFMLLAIAQWLSTLLGFWTFCSEHLTRLDWHQNRGLSFFQLGLRTIQRLQHLQRPLPRLQPLPHASPPKAVASIRKQAQLDSLIQFSKVSFFSST